MSDYTKLRVFELREELEQRGLDTKGRKADLVARLEEDDGGDEAAPMAVDWSTLKVAELRAALKKRGLDTKGRKAALVARLEAADDDDEPEPVPAKRSGRKRRRAADDDDEEEEPIAPKKTTKKKATKKKATKKKATKKAAKTAAVTTPAKAGKKKNGFAVDSYCTMSGATGVEDYNAMLNQTNIAQNNNKYYVIQVVTNGRTYGCWTRWGRVGEPGQNKMIGQGSKDNAIKAFEKKFKDKTRNAWKDRDNFVPKPKKYTLMEIADDDDDVEELEEALSGMKQRKSKGFEPSELDKGVQKLMSLIFDTNMFQHAMKEFEIDTKKMPLGKIAPAQIEKAMDVLESIKNIHDGKSRGNVTALSSKFYTLIPHSFGRRVPPPLNTAESVQNKFDMLNVLLDIEKANSQREENEQNAEENENDLLPNPLDTNYDSLHCDLEAVPKNSDEYKTLYKYMSQTQSTNNWRRIKKVLNIFRVNRHSEAARFAAHDDIENRKLLWHGTNVAVVAAILTTGLRIMPHSGGRVGRGIYLASENAKSSSYTRGDSKGEACMFLCEAALGREHSIDMDDPSLRKAPKGYDSIVARGRQEPDPEDDVTMDFDGKEVVVPQGKAISQSEWSHSRFHNSEYLLYKESQVRIRYVFHLKF